MKHRETPLSHVLFVMALGFALLVAINLLGCEIEREVVHTVESDNTEGAKLYVEECMYIDNMGVVCEGDILAEPDEGGNAIIVERPSPWAQLSPDRDREVLLRENEELHYNNMIRARIIEELMERVDRCEEKP